MFTSLLKNNSRLVSALALVLTGTVMVLAFAAYWSSFIQWCLAVQISLHRYLVNDLLQLNNNRLSGAIWLMAGAFVYGILHAVGPGHGKFIVTTYLSTHQEKRLASRLIPFLGCLMQGVSAILFVFILAVGFNLASGDLSLSRWYVEKISALFIAAFGLFISYRALQALGHPVIRSLPPAPHTASCGCGHHHLPDINKTSGNLTARLGVILAVGARPCSGAIMILLFSNAIGIVSWGIAAVMVMSAGTGLAIVGLSVLVTHARAKAFRLYGRSARQPTRLLPLLRLAGGVLLLLFATVLFASVIPVSPNGDYIAAGC